MNGNSPGFSAYLARFPETGAVVVVLANNDIPLATTLGDDLVALLFNEPVQPPARPTPVPLSDGALDGVEGTYRFPYGFEVTLTVRGGRLFFRSVWPQYETELIPVGQDEFFHRYYWDALELDRGADGTVSSIRWRESPETEAERLQ